MMKNKKNTIEFVDEYNIQPNRIITKTRRQVLKASLASGVVLGSSQWVKPVINVAVLPAHAQTSIDADTDETDTDETDTDFTCSNLTVEFSGNEFYFNSDDNGTQNSTLQITNTSAVTINLSASTVSSAMGETYFVDFSSVSLEPGETGDLTLSVDFTELNSFCSMFDNAQALTVTVSENSALCEAVDIESVPFIEIGFGC